MLQGVVNRLRLGPIPLDFPANVPLSSFPPSVAQELLGEENSKGMGIVQ